MGRRYSHDKRKNKKCQYSSKSSSSWWSSSWSSSESKDKSKELEPPFRPGRQLPNGASFVPEGPCALENCFQYILNTRDGFQVRFQEWYTSKGQLNNSDNKILFLPGFPHSHEVWVKTTESFLADKYRLVTFELRGQANAPLSIYPMQSEDYTPERYANDIQDLVELFELEGAVLACHSKSGIVASAYAETYPVEERKLGGVVLVGAFTQLNLADPDVTDATFTEAAQEITPLLLNDNDLKLYLDANQEFVRLSSFQPIPKPFPTQIYGNMFLTTVPVRLAQLLPPLNFRNFFLLTYRNLPTLTVVGEKDALIRPSHQICNAALMRGKLKLLPCIGHLPQLEDIKGFNKILNRFMKKNFH